VSGTVLKFPARPSEDEAPYLDAPAEIVEALGGKVPTVQQWRAITHGMDPCAVVAGAGSGKTAVMAARVVYLAMVATGRLEADHKGVPPSEVLCLTFTNKATDALARRVREATGGLALPEGEEATVLTYHSFADRLVREYGLALGMEPGQRLITDAQRWQLALSLLEDRAFQHLEIRTLTRILPDVLALADECANHLVEPEAVAEHGRALAEDTEVKADNELMRTARKRVELAELVAAYRDRKRELGLLDYGDQIVQACRVVEAHPEVAQEFRERYRVVLLDEYQDTNIAQARLLALLCGPGHPVMAVGDPDQNIYAWRGASLANILRVHEEFGTGDDGVERPLYVNFRSGSRILDVANVIIDQIPPQRRAPDKTLRPHPERGEGRVRAFVATDEREEARRIAELIKECVAKEKGSWQDVAVLCRKKRLFGPIAEVLSEEGIPVEVVDLGGLLKLPEIVELASWLRLLEDPSHNVALARVLQGPRWRIGYRDLVALARWSARHNRVLSDELAGEDVRPGDVRFALAEALDHLDDEDMTGLSDEARTRLKEFRQVLAELRHEARGTVSDLVAEVMERSGLLPELEASDSDVARAAKRNLLNFVDHVSAFAPVEGEASLPALMEYLNAAEQSEDELEPIQISEANTVKLLTIHKAKGLEWPMVFVPGLAAQSRTKLFPDTMRQPNPVKQPQRLPFELRGDAELLPKYEGKVAPFRAQLEARALEEERRLCYVALTRARDELIVSAAHWYEGPQDAFEPSTFYQEVTGHAACEEIDRAETPEENPLIARRGERAKGWPGRGKDDDVDELFPEGWHAAAREAADDGTHVDRRAAELPPDDQPSFRDRVRADLERAELIRERTRPQAGPAVPSTLSVSGVLEYLTCPKRFYWSYLQPLPRKPNPRARLGSDIHRWIELQSRGQATLLEVDALPDLSVGERLGEPGVAERLKEAFTGSRFAQITPLYTERPFILYLDGIVIGGRIDAVFGTPDGPWEVVDYKTGRLPSEDDPLFGLQLDLYALACIEIWRKRPEDLTLTYFFLAEGEERSRKAGDPAQTRARVKEALAGITGAKFDATPGEQCRWCDFLSFCEPGRGYVEPGSP